MINKYTIPEKIILVAGLTDDVVLNIEADKNRYWFEKLGGFARYRDEETKIVNEIEKEIFTNIVFGSEDYADLGITKEDLAFIKEMYSVEKDLEKQVLDGIRNNINKYNETLEKIDKDSENELISNDLTDAILSFQGSIAHYLDNYYISANHWGTDRLVDIVKSFVRLENEVTIECRGYSVDIDVMTEQGFDEKGYVEKYKDRFNTDQIAKGLLDNTVYFLTHSEIVAGGSSLFGIANDFMLYEDIEKSNEKAKDEIAKCYVLHHNEPNFWKDYCFSDWFKDYFHHRPYSEEDYEMLTKRYEEAVKEGRIEAEDEKEPYIINVNLPEEIDIYTNNITDKAEEIANIIKTNSKTVRFNEEPINIDIWQKQYPDGKRTASIEIKNGGQAIKLSYEDYNIKSCTYNDHIFHKGEWRNTVERYEEDSMKPVLKDIFTLLNNPEKFNPNIETDKKKKEVVKE